MDTLSQECSPYDYTFATTQSVLGEQFRSQASTSRQVPFPVASTQPSLQQQLPSQASSSQQQMLSNMKWKQSILGEQCRAQPTSSIQLPLPMASAQPTLQQRLNSYAFTSQQQEPRLMPSDREFYRHNLALTKRQTAMQKKAIQSTQGQQLGAQAASSSQPAEQTPVSVAFLNEPESVSFQPFTTQLAGFWSDSPSFPVNTTISDAPRAPRSNPLNHTSTNLAPTVPKPPITQINNAHTSMFEDKYIDPRWPCPCEERWTNPYINTGEINSSART